MQIIDAHPLLAARAANSWNLEYRSIGGGVNLDGQEQVVVSPMPRWRAEIRLGLLSQPERRELRAYLMRLRGRAGAVRLKPVCRAPDAFYARLSAVLPTADVRASGVTHDDGVLFSDGSGYDGALPPMALAQAAEAFSRSLLLDTLGYARGLVVGDWLGLGGRLHCVIGVFADDTVYRIEVEPPLRLDLPAGAPVDLEPSAVMQLTADSGGFVGVDYGSPPPVTLSFVEKPGVV